MNRTRAPPREAEVRQHLGAPDAGCVARRILRTAINHMTRRLIMSKVSVPGLMLLCAALAACSDGTVTAPGAAASLSEAPADLGAYTVDGPSEFGLASEDASAQLAGAQILGAQLATSAQSSSGSRSTGHVGLFTTGPATGIASERYSYTALQTDLATLAAKGQYEIQYTAVTGVEIKIHGEVSCMIVFGSNTARASGPITKVWRNGVQIPITANTHAFWVVVDNGEGAANPDFVSLVRFSNAAIAQNFCVNGFGSIVYANQEGNIQVQP